MNFRDPIWAPFPYTRGMKANHVPQTERLRQRIGRLQARYEDSRGPKGRGNPYWCCKECGITDPEVSIRNGHHRGRCHSAGILKEIAYYQGLLAKGSS